MKIGHLEKLTGLNKIFDGLNFKDFLINTDNAKVIIPCENEYSDFIEMGLKIDGTFVPVLHLEKVKKECVEYQNAKEIIAKIMEKIVKDNCDCLYPYDTIENFKKYISQKEKPKERAKVQN